MKCSKNPSSSFFSEHSGFTLVEMLIVLMISSLIMAALFTAYITQQRSQTAQDQIVEMQQNLRSGFNFLQREMRMAGFDPQGGSGAGITTATDSTFEFSQDINDNGAGEYPGNGDATESGEIITYDLAGDADDDGVVDDGIDSLTRDMDGVGAGSGAQPVANNIEAVEFLYLVGDDLTPTLAPVAGQFDEIRSVVVSMLARTSVPDPDFQGGPTYLPASNDPDFHDGMYDVGSGKTWGSNDNFRRRLLITTVQLRNMNL
jgi:type IV pilus assembly protein PilW